jgi:hypothetical protein
MAYGRGPSEAYSGASRPLYTRSGAASWPTSPTSAANWSPPSPKGRRKHHTSRHTSGAIGGGRRVSIRTSSDTLLNPCKWGKRYPGDKTDNLTPVD